MTHEAFEEEYGHQPTTWPKAIHQREFDWWTPDVVYVCEHYRVEETTDLIHVFRGLDDVDMKVPDSELKADPNKLPTLLATGFREVRQKRVKRRVVNKYILSGLQVEEDMGPIAGKCIPIVPFYGKRWFVDNVERCQGHVRLAKDAQRLTNSLLSWLTELAGRFDMEKPIVSPEQMKGHATMWAEDNVKRFPYLLLNLLKDADGNVVPGVPLDYTKAPNVPPAMAALIQIAYQALDDLLGNQQAGEQLQPNMSGKAVELIQTRLDMQVFIYMSNFAKTMQRVGEVWLSMSKDILIEDGRQMKTLSSDGEPDTVTLRRLAGRGAELELQARGHRARADRHRHDHPRPGHAAGADRGVDHEHGRRGPAGAARLLPLEAGSHGRRPADRRGKAGAAGRAGQHAAGSADAVSAGLRLAGRRRCRDRARQDDLDPGRCRPQARADGAHLRRGDGRGQRPARRCRADHPRNPDHASARETCKFCLTIHKICSQSCWTLQIFE
jgi:portal protein